MRAMNIRNILVSTATCCLVAFMAPLALAQGEPKEVITSLGSFPLDERGLWPTGSG